MSQVVTNVPFLDLGPQYRELEAEWFAMIRESGARGSFILGPNATAFEAEAARYVGVKHAIGVANGTDALWLALRALGIGPGDEVITTPFTFFATSEAVDVVGATPVFADIEADSFCLDPESVRKKITLQTKAIIPVHLFGLPARMTEIMAIAREHGLAVLEDCAQAFGARAGESVVGSISDAGAFSFYPTKVLGCYGDGGLITTNRDDLNEHIRRLRNHGATSPFVHVEVGCNSRLDEIQAALLRLKLKRIETDIAGRRKVAARYNELLAGLPVTLPSAEPGERHAYNLYTVRFPQRRDSVRAALTEAKIGTSQCYPMGNHLQAVYRHLGYQPGSLPVCEKACTETLSLPIYPDMPDLHIVRVSEVVRAALG